MRSVTPEPTRSNRRAGRRAAWFGVLAVVLAACGTGGIPTGTPASPAGTASATASAASPASSGATPAPTVPLPGSDGDRPDLAGVRVALETAYTGLAAPIVVTPGDDSGRLFIAEQGGRIRIATDGVLRDRPFIDLSERISAGGERGLLGLAFPPGYGSGRSEFYVHYSDLAGDTVIAAYETSAADPDVADPGTERIILQQPQPYSNHNGGWIGFDGDGMLLIALGDGGAGGDPENRASDLGTILGKMLRIDVLGAEGDEPYRIPEDNPFVDRADARPEILHYGLRNPFRASVDFETGNLWMGDVGQNAWEEVDVAPGDARGLDFGWRRWEGRHCFDEAAGCVETGVTMPVTEYPHADGCSVIGGVVYRGDAIPALRGAYLFSDYCSGTLWAIDAGLDAAQAPIVLVETGRSISSIGIDDTGEVLLTDLGGGEVLRLVGAG
jgi:glucose/arabinose dehydrogenase